MQSLNYEITTLDNGIRVITETVNHVQFMSMGFWVGVGSRYESEKQWGITHFIEHMLFKGTEKRTADQISGAVDAVGGQLNAFTSKENTCYYIKTLTEDFPLAVDVLSDMFLNSRFDNEEIAKEREVIIEEIKMYEDTPDDQVHDLMSANLWPDHPLGRAILGTEESIAAFDHDMLKDYMKQYYTGSNIVVSVVGNISHKQVVDAIQEVLGGIPKGEPNQYAIADRAKAGVNCYYKEIAQSQICVAMPGVAKEDDRLFPLSILNTYLGGGMSSRLVKKIREEEGLAYSVYSYNGSYTDTGAFVISVGTRPENCQRVIDIILEELEDVRQNGITQDELDKSFSQLKGSLYMGLETVNSRMNKLGRSLLIYDRVITPEENVDDLSKVTVEDVKALAGDMFRRENLQITVLGPVEDVKM
ncbi:MAG: insulinase family protein [Peptococcaceae bacterium]|jgi:predicted Zn-dependent peptidase|nr:insulinase family protein [Peptococcaceae bacterium]